ncbi:uncharacterized protein MJAP1_001572 [Malassezia japonica]|uniref:Uncharacterized protein n=1 Tax=Malassezia japonica TaxID=223818 RepID=A0AAF0F162_9BASI|nr:uncharacterized protein MJAP1_001572 [Malassezia japonica]WFD38612.1 hypothetical protein MJAP1_001572 [Malassezia japonica]
MNRTLEDAANPTYGLLDNILTNMTFQLWPLVAGTHYRRVQQAYLCLEIQGA